MAEVKEIEFSPIDGKDYGPVSLEYEYPVSLENIVIMARLKKEYFSRLLALQKELKEKYQPLIVEESEDAEEPEWEEEREATAHYALTPEEDALWYS